MAAKTKAGRQVNGSSEAYWDFATASTRTMTHGLHPYPARMVPQLTRELVRRYSRNGDIVYDPFVGSGTTLVESSILGRHSIGLDTNPFALLLSRVKTTPIHPSLLLTEWQMLQKAIFGRSASTRARQARTLESKFLDISYWYKPYVVRDLSFLRTIIDDYYPVGTDSIGDFFRLAFARVVREASNQRPFEFKRWRRLPDQIDRFRPSPIQGFAQEVERSIPLMSGFYRSRKPWVTVRLYRQDARKYKLLSPADLIVTSPPYGDSSTTIPYGQFSSFAMEWLGLHDVRPTSLDREPMGPQAHSDSPSIDASPTLKKTMRKMRLGDGVRSKQMIHFFDGMLAALKNMNASLAAQGRCCVVVGNRRVCGVYVPTDAILSETAMSLGFELEEVFHRKIYHKTMPAATTPTGRKRCRGPSQATMDSEAILVFKAS